MEMGIKRGRIAIIIIWSIFASSCFSKEGALPYHPPEFAPMYKEECYAEHKNWLCMDKDKEEIKYIPESFIYFLFMGNEINVN